MSVCLRCGGVGHFAKECSQPPTCNNCGGRGHLAKTCPAIRCDRCGKAGHMARECTRGGNLKCYECQESGHLAKDCPFMLKKRVKEPDFEQLKKSHELNLFKQAKARVATDDASKTPAASVSLWDREKGKPPSKKMRVGSLRPVTVMKKKGSGAEDGKDFATEEQEDNSDNAGPKKEDRDLEHKNGGVEQVTDSGTSGAGTTGGGGGLGLLAGYDSASDDE